MTPGALRALEFDRVVSVVVELAVTATGRERLAAMRPLTSLAAVAGAQRATSEGVAFLADHPGFPLRAPADLRAIIDLLAVDGRPLEPLRLLGLADFLESVAHSCAAVRHARGTFPLLDALVARAASFTSEVSDVRRKIDPSGEVADTASPALASIRTRLRRQRAALRTTLESFIRGRETAKYLQDQVITDRNGRFVLVVKAEHRASVPGIVHGASASGASLFLEPMATVDINNDIVALEEEEAEEVHRILLALTDSFRSRPDDLERTVEVATELDAIQARARFSEMVDGAEPILSDKGAFELRGARHPLLIPRVAARLESRTPNPESRVQSPVPNDILLAPPARVMVITGPNTGGKTVALKTAGLLALMAQSGLHIPADAGSRLPVFQTVFADIGDEQSISASLSTFSAHIANVVSMIRDLQLPGLVLLDEVGAGTDPVEGGALGIAVIDHFRGRGAHLVATTHYDALKSYASTTAGVIGAGFGFDAESFAPTYRLIYGSPGRSLAIEIARRLGMPASVVAAARDNLTEEQKRLADHLTRMDRDLHAIATERSDLVRDRVEVAERERALRGREDSLREREEVFRRRLDARLQDQLRDARREIDAVIEDLKARAPRLVNTGQTGSVRSEARSAVERVVDDVRQRGGVSPSAPATAESPSVSSSPLALGARVRVGGLGFEGVVVGLHGRDADIDVRGKRLRAAAGDLTVIEGAPAAARVSVRVDLQPRTGSASELNVVGATVDEAITCLEKFLDESTVGDQHTIRIIHGHGTGQLRRAIGEFLKAHPLVSRVHAAPQDQGGAGVTLVELRD